MWYCKYFAIKMMFRCNRNKYSRANDSQEVNKTWLVLLGRVKTMKKSNYLIIFFEQASASCFQALTIESIALVAAILRLFLSRRAWYPGRWSGMANFKISSHLCRLLTILSWCHLKIYHFLIMSFCDIEENTKEQNGGRSSVIWSFFRPLTLRRGSWGVAYNTHQRSEDLRKLKNVKSQKSPPHLKVEHQGWTIACSNKQTGKVDTFFKWIISFVFVVSW